MIKYLFLFLFGSVLQAQNVSTFFSDSSRDVDDSMIFNSNGDLFGSNFNGDTVYKINGGASATPFVTGLSNPNGLALDADENLFVCEYSAQKINKYDSSGSFIESYPIGGFPSGLLRSFDGAAMIFTNVSNNSVNRLSSNGNISVLFQGSPLNAPVGLAYDDLGNLYVGNFVGHEIYKIENGSATYVATVPNGGATGGNAALGFITFANGKLYGTNFGGHQIYTINQNAVDDVTLFAGGAEGNDDGPVGSATFSFPNGIVFNQLQNALYVSEFSGVGNIRKIDGIPLGVTDFDLEVDLVVSPNPSSDFINISFSEGTKTSVKEISIYDTTGRKIRTYQEIEFEGSGIQLDISNLHQGLYIVKVINEAGSQASKSIIVK